LKARGQWDAIVEKYVSERSVPMPTTEPGS